VTAGLDAELQDAVETSSRSHHGQLVDLRRELHAHPELAWGEYRTTEAVRTRLEGAGLDPDPLPRGTGLTCDIGSGDQAVALRADLDALGVPDEKDVPYSSTIPGHCHACGHDVHTAVVVGAGLVLADLERAGRLDGRVRLLFQPAEEVTPGGALEVIAARRLEDVRRIFTIHCDPQTSVGQVGLRVGPVTGSADHVRVRLSGRGGHTARPHRTEDLVFALGKVITEVPAVLSRRVDPRVGMTVVWGRVLAGAAANVIPRTGEVEGTVRMLDAAAWELAPAVVAEAVRAAAAPYGVEVEIDYTRGVPPVVNDGAAVEALSISATAFGGPDAVTDAEQSLGAEDFAWYLGQAPGALARLGVRRHGDTVSRDLHQGTFDVDEAAIGVGVRLLVGAALLSVS
jgi:amidohydrolase